MSEKQRATVLRLQQHLSELPLLPAVVLDLLRLDPRDERYFEKVSDLVGHDPPFAARVLRAANSAALGPAHAHPISTIHDAVVRLGARGAVDLIVTQSATRVFLPHTDWERSLWAHAISVGIIAQRLSALTRAPKVDAGAAYLGGLMHDVGRFVLYLEAPDELRAIDETEWDTPASLVATEKAMCGFTHAELGYLAALKWKLPADLAIVIQHHHALELAPPLVPAHLVPLIKLVRVADWLAVLFAKRGWQTAPEEPLRDIVMRHGRDLFVATAPMLVRETCAALEQADLVLRELGLGAETSSTSHVG